MNIKTLDKIDSNGMYKKVGKEALGEWIMEIFL